MTVIFAVSASAKNVGVTVTSQRYVPDQTDEKSIRKVRIIWRYVPYQTNEKSTDNDSLETDHLRS